MSLSTVGEVLSGGSNQAGFSVVTKVIEIVKNHEDSGDPAFEHNGAVSTSYGRHSDPQLTSALQLSEGTVGACSLRPVVQIAVVVFARSCILLTS